MFRLSTKRLTKTLMIWQLPWSEFPKRSMFRTLIWIINCDLCVSVSILCLYFSLSYFKCSKELCLYSSVAENTHNFVTLKHLKKHSVIAEYHDRYLIFNFLVTYSSIDFIFPQIIMTLKKHEFKLEDSNFLWIFRFAFI